jgi:aminodeoxyfutalosine synthase
MAGAESPQLQTEADMLKAIREVGRTPVQRNTFYEPLKVQEGPASGDAPENGAHSKVLEDNLATA